MSGRDSLKEGFYQECEDLLEVMSDGFTQMEEAPEDSEVVNAVFRAVHSIKGGAGAFGLNALVGFAHGFENLLDDIRGGKVAVTDAVMPLLYRSGDRLYDLVEAARSGRDVDPSEHADLLGELSAAGAGGHDDADAGGDDPEAEAAFVPMAATLDLGDLGLPDLDAEPAASDPPADGVHRFRFTPERGLYAAGNDPLPLLRALSELGTMQVEADLAAVPLLRELEWDGAYLSWIITLEGNASRADVLEVFEFVEADSRIEFLDGTADTPVPGAAGDSPEPATEPGTAPAEQISAEDEMAAFAAMMMGEDAGDTASISPLSGSAKSAAEPTPTPEPAAAKSARSGGSSAAGSGGQASSARQQSIRVDLDRVDRLINLVGELVISEAMLTQSLSESGSETTPAVGAALGRLKQLSTELQERIMAIRAQSVKSLFQRMSRIVRESGQAAGKEVRLVTEGDTTEVDKTVIERLADPLTHMLRNSVDHGIEPCDKRLAAGKPETGTVRLSAAHRSGQVVIEIADDGAGIDTERVFAKAVDKGLVSPDADLSENEIFALLFEPGFSTAQQVSSLSGRGVGMDVVRSEIQALGGRVTISSKRGEGTAVAISLPLTLAVVEGMLVEVADETLVVPSTALRETLLGSETLIHRLGSGDPVLSVRGMLIPVMDLGARLGYRSVPENLAGLPILLVETAAGRLVALTVDRIADQREVVIKGLTENYGQVAGIAAATILGDGRIALIIDIDQVSEAAPNPSPDDLMPAMAAMGG